VLSPPGAINNIPAVVAVYIALVDGRRANRERQLYKNISMLFLFPVKDGKLSTGVIAIFNASCYG